MSTSNASGYSSDESRNVGILARLFEGGVSDPEEQWRASFRSITLKPYWDENQRAICMVTGAGLQPLGCFPLSNLAERLPSLLEAELATPGSGQDQLRDTGAVLRYQRDLERRERKKAEAAFDLTGERSSKKAATAGLLALLGKPAT